jgi:thioredoxin reductase
MSEQYDVVVVGGGAAGLSGALTLGRARRSVLVIDSGEPRNAAASSVHTYLTREGSAPAHMLAVGRAEVAEYGVRFQQGRVANIERTEDGGFRLAVEDGQDVRARRLLIATGLVDKLPDIPGIAERWGRDVLHCPYCHGWEVRDQAIGILASGPMAVQHALLWRQWSEDVTLFSHTAPQSDDDELERLAARGISVVEGKVTGLEIADDRLAGLRVADGRVIACDAVVVEPCFIARADLLGCLNVEATEQEADGHVLGTHIAADPNGSTEADGVWVAGDIADGTDQVVSAAAAGVRAGAAINVDLVEEETRQAVAAARRAVLA